MNFDAVRPGNLGDFSDGLNDPLVTSPTVAPSGAVIG